MRARENPFAVEHIHRLGYRWEVGSWNDFRAHLAAHRFRGAIVGHEGAGKTTLLEELARQLEARGWRVRMLKLTRSEPAFPPRRLRAVLADLQPDHVLLFDGAEQLNWWRFRQFVSRTRAAGGLIVTTHRPGRLPTLLECRSSLAMTHTLVGELWGARNASLDALVAQLFVAHQGNVRDVLRALYDRCARGELGTGDRGQGTGDRTEDRTARASEA